MEVKYLDLYTQYREIKKEIDSKIVEVIENSAFSGGFFVEKFEEEFSNYCDVKYSVGVSSGTSALWMALKAVGVEKDDEVITVPNSFIATAEAISMCGGIPVFVDVDPVSCTMDASLVESRITAKTKAIIPVHLYGQMADMKSIMAVAQKYGVKVIEDAAQAHGAEQHGIKAGGYGDAGCFSFYPGKNLGAFGEAGGVVTGDREIYERVCMLRDHGQLERYNHACIGSNERMDGIQAAVLGVKLRYLDVWNDGRRELAALYNELLSGKERLVLPKESQYNKHVYHIYQIQTDERAKIVDNFKKKNIGFGIHYPIPIHLQKAYNALGYKKGDFNVSEFQADRTLSIPMYPNISLYDVEYVSNTIIGMV